MIEKFIKQTEFSSMEDFKQNLEFTVPDHFNFAYDVIDAWAETDPERLAMIWVSDKDEERRFTFADLKRESDKVAGYFTSIGIGRGDMVMTILKRRYQFWTTVLALHKIGAIVVPATFLLTTNDIVYRCKSAEIKAIVCCGDKPILEKVAAAEPKCPYLEHMISIGPEVPEGFEDFEAGVASATPWERGSFLNESEDPFLMYFTSGTSDEPKMVLHAHTYAISHLVTAAFWHNLKEDSLHLTYSDTGWGKAAWGKLYGQWIVGCAIFVYDHEKFVPAEILGLIGKYRITSFCAPPTIYRFLIKEHFNCFDLSSLKYCTTAGEALNPSVFEEFHRRTGIWIHEAFGQTETTMTLGTFPWVKPRPGSMGIPSPAYDIDILRPDGTRADVGESGVIVIRTDKKKPLGLFLGYYRNPKLTRKAWHDGIYYTGDVAYRDEDGYFWFVGRNDDLIKTSGYRVSPFEVESALMTHPAVLECAVTGVPDPEELRGMVVKATVVVTGEYRKSLATPESRLALIKDIQAHAKRMTAPYKYPRIIEFADELPKTISGKIRHNEIRNQDARK
ncbi:MAG: AMP-binding protein [Candidatus Cryptobacteroides sp.]|nr:AMP-binding protein [Candidatus Cryptobacteroides sp.]